MREITIKLYSFDELSESAQSRAWMDYTNECGEFLEDSEFRATLAAFEKTFDCDVYRWYVDENSYNFAVSHSREGSFDCWLRFTRWLWNNYGDAILRGKYYGKLVYREGERPRHVKRYSKASFDHDCTLTGFYADSDITDPIWKCLHYKEAFFNYDQLLEACLDSFFSSWRDAMEYELSIEHFAELCEANEYEFTEYGEQWRG